MRQMHSDRRVWVYASELGILMIHDHVDDTRMTYTDDRARDHFYLHWATEFGEPPQSRGLVEDFTGLRHHFVESGAVEITCLGVIRSLAVLVAPYPVEPNTPYNTPMSTSMLHALVTQAPGIGLREDLVPSAQRLTGTIGFIANNARPDAYFAYCVAARYARPEALTDLAFAAIVRVAHYLVETQKLSLTILPSPHGVGDLLRGYCDASHGNGERGSSYAGRCSSPQGAGPSRGSAYRLFRGTMLLDRWSCAWWSRPTSTPWGCSPFSRI